MHRGLPRLAIAAAAALSLLSAPAAQAAVPDKWGHWLTGSKETSEVTVRSVDFLGNLYMSTDGGGVYSSPGNSFGPWDQVNDGLNPQTGSFSAWQVKVGPDGQLYASTSAGLFRSPPPGDAWQPVGQEPGPRKLNMGGVQAVTFPSPSPSDIVVAVAGAGGAGVYYTSDGGVHWDRASGMPSPTSVFHIISPLSGTPMYAATDSGVWISVDFGRSWVAYSDGIPPGETVLRVAFPPEDPTHLYASTSSGVYKFNKEKVAWEDASGGDNQTLPAAGGKRSFLLTPPLDGKFGNNRGVVGTESGAWATIDDGAHWGQMSTEVQSNPADPSPLDNMNKVVWSLSVGFTSPTLVAGLSGFGAVTLPLQPVEDGTVTIGPVAGLKPGTELTHQKAGFAGTKPIFFKYQWRRCEGDGCNPTTAIPGATGSTYVIPKDDAGKRVRYSLYVEARNLVHPQFVSDVSNVTADADIEAAPGTTPMPSTVNAEKPSLTPTVSSDWGTVYTINNGKWRTEASAVDVTAQTTFTYQWRRCKASACSIIPGETGSTYTATPQDIAHSLEAYIKGTRGGISSQYYLAGVAQKVKNKFPVNTNKPVLLGDAFTGRTLSSTAGGWDGHDMRFERRWLRCEADGLGCNPTNPVNTSSTYTLTAADHSKRIQLEVTAIAEDESQDRVTKAYSEISPVITDPPVEPGITPTPTPGAATPTPTPTPTATVTPTPVKKPVIKISKPKTVKAGVSLKVPAVFPGFRSVKYQWLRNGKKIKRATKRTYKIKRTDRGKKISCRITLTPSAGGAAVTVTTKAIKVPTPKRRRRG